MVSLMIVDGLIILTAIIISYSLLEPTIKHSLTGINLITFCTILCAQLSFSWHFGLYRKAWMYVSIEEMKSIFIVISLTFSVTVITQLVFFQTLHFRFLVLAWMTHILLIGSSRISWRLLGEIINKRASKATIRTMIIGAGQAGRMVARQVLQNPKSGMKPVVFVDDDGAKCGLEIYGVKVVRGTDRIEDIVNEYKIDKVVIAIPSLSKQKMFQLSKSCIDAGIKTQTIPRIEDLITGKVSVNEMRDVNIKDLLGREEVKLDLQLIAENITNKTILVTGAGGSIGSEICRQVYDFKPKKLVLLGHGENSIYTIEKELIKKNNKLTEIIPIIADVKERARITSIIRDYKPDIIYHAAAHKHVPLMESNPYEAVKTNIFGTKNVAEAANTLNVPYFVMISTDKAVNPPNVMGASKRFAEMIVQNLSKKSETKFVSVRFGNVLGSSGSVVPLFMEQIRSGGPVTVTAPEMTRYFMTIPEASRLVIQAGTLASNGEIFVLDMGKPVKIVDLAKNLITLSGHDEDEIGIEFSGIRPGEKLFEELLNENEILSNQIFPKIHIGKATPVNELELNSILEKLPLMSDREVKETLLEVANRKVVVEARQTTTA